MMQQRQEPTYEEPARSRRVQRRSGSGNGDSGGDDVGDGSKAAVNDTSLQDPPLNQYAQVPSDIHDTGIASDAGPQPAIASAGPLRETTGSVGSSGSATEPLPYEPPEPANDNESGTVKVVKWLLIKGAGLAALTYGGPVGAYAFITHALASNGKNIRDGTKAALEKNEAENELHNERVAPAIESMQRNADQGMKPFGSDLSDKNIFGE
jgi:hypothetical protein